MIILRPLALAGVLTALMPSFALAQEPASEPVTQEAAPSPAEAGDGSAQVAVDVETRPFWLLVGVGSAVFVGQYVAELVVTAATGGSSSEVRRAAIPLVGGWLKIANEDDLRGWQIALTVVEGVVSALALTAVVVGFAWRRPVAAASDETTWLVLPNVREDGTGGGLEALVTW